MAEQSGDVSARSGRCWWRCVGLVLLIACGFILWTGFDRTPAAQAEGTKLEGEVKRKPTTRTTLKVGTFNIRGGVGMDNRLDLQRIADVIGDCDVVGLNEVTKAFDGPDEATVLGEKLGLAHLYAPSERRWWRDHWGNAMLSALPVEHWVKFPMNKTKPNGYRSVLISRQLFNGHAINVITTHTDGSQDRDAQVRTVTSLFISMAEPAILMGDFNSAVTHPEIQKMLQVPGVSDCLIDAVKHPVKYRIDFIFAKGFRVVDAGTIDKGASDHPFYWAELELK